MCDAYLSLAGIFILGTLSIMTVDKYLHTKCFFPFLILREGYFESYELRASFNKGLCFLDNQYLYK